MILLLCKSTTIGKNTWEHLAVKDNQASPADVAEELRKVGAIGTYNILATGVIHGVPYWYGFTLREKTERSVVIEWEVDPIEGE